MQCVERKIFIKTVNDSPQSSIRGLAFQVDKYLGLRVSHETIRNVLENTNILQKTPAISTKRRKEIILCYRTRFAASGVLG